MVDFWEMSKNEYDPSKILNQISKGNQFGTNWGKIIMNGDDSNFAGGILESTDRNILMPNPV